VFLKMKPMYWKPTPNKVHLSDFKRALVIGG
jgi:hypothetical protein